MLVLYLPFFPNINWFFCVFISDPISELRDVDETENDSKTKMRIVRAIIAIVVLVVSCGLVVNR